MPTRNENEEVVVTERIDDEQIQFLLHLLDATVGGRPAMCIRKDGGSYLVVPTCECEGCQAFLEQMERVPTQSLIQAMENYTRDRFAFRLRHSARDRALH
jgi:hypothetical protein